MTIGQRISKCRKDKNLSQEYIAELMEVSRQAVSKWENDLTEPDTANLIKLSKIFDVSVEYLANGEEIQPRIEYIERGVPLSKTIAVILISLGGLSALLGILLSWILIAVAILLVTYGVLMLTAKKEGAVVGASMATLAVVLLLIQGLTGGFEVTNIFAILLVSIGAPILVWGAVKLVKLARSGQLCKLSEWKKKMTKKHIIITIVVVFVVLSLILGICLGLRAKKKEALKASWFDEEYLANCNIPGMPSVGGSSRAKLNSREILLNFNSEETYELYALFVYNYLESNNFMHLGTRGSVLSSFGENVTYELVDCKNLKDFKVNTSENNGDYIFVYSKDRGSASGELACHVVYLDKVDNRELVVDGERISYNAVLSIYPESHREAYKLRTIMTREIIYKCDDSIWYGTQPVTAISDWAVVLRTIPISGADIVLYVNGKPIEKTKENELYWEYKFVMPREDAIISAEITGKSHEPPTSVKLVEQETWLADLDVGSIAEVKFAWKNQSALDDSCLVYINTASDKEIIEEFLRQYKAVLLAPADISEVPMYGGGWLYAEFIMTDGTKHKVRFEAGHYKDSEDRYYSTSIIPTLAPFDAEKVKISVSLALSDESYKVYNADGTERPNVSGLSELEFHRYEGDVIYKTENCLYYIETELGTIYICSDTVFMFKSGDDREPQANELISGSLFELLGVN